MEIVKVMVDFLKFIADFLNNNIGLVTFFVGFIAIYLYLKQKKDNKREAAKLILQEIRYAEQQIRQHKNSNQVSFYLADKILPTNSWNRNIHHFIKDIKEESHIDLISKFYSNSQYIDSLIEKISEIKSGWYKIDDQVVIPEIQNLLTVLKKEVRQPIVMGDSTQSISTQQPQMQSLKSSFSLINIESNASLILKEVTSEIEFIYNTPAVEKLRKISERRWYQLF